MTGVMLREALRGLEALEARPRVTEASREVAVGEKCEVGGGLSNGSGEAPFVGSGWEGMMIARPSDGDGAAVAAVRSRSERFSSMRYRRGGGHPWFAGQTRGRGLEGSQQGRGSGTYSLRPPHRTPRAVRFGQDAREHTDGFGGGHKVGVGDLEG